VYTVGCATAVETRAMSAVARNFIFIRVLFLFVWFALGGVYIEDVEATGGSNSLRGWSLR